MAASSTSNIAVCLPLTISLVTILGTIVIHGFAVVIIVRFIRRQHLLGRTGVRFWGDVAIVSGVTLIAGAAHMLEIMIWAVVFAVCGEFTQLAPAFYNSAMLYTTSGYGDAVMSPAWRLLAPAEAGDGLLMFGVSTAMVISTIQLMVRRRFQGFANS